MYDNHMGPGYNPQGAGQPVAWTGRTRGNSRALGCSTTVLWAAPFLLAILAIAAFWIGIPTWHVLIAGVQTQGTIIQVEDCGPSQVGPDHSPGPETFKAVIQFTDQQGQVHQVESHECSNGYNIGEQISLRYVPDDPSSFLTDFDALGICILTVGGGGMALLLVVALLVAVFILLRARWQAASQPEVWG